MIDIAKASTVRVMIIPTSVKYHQVKRAVVPCDLNAIPRLALIKKVLQSFKWLHPELLILNIDSKQEHQGYKYEHEGGLKDMLGKSQYDVLYSANPDIVQGVLDIAIKHDAQLIIALPGRHSFLYNLTQQNITKALALNNSKPVLILK